MLLKQWIWLLVHQGSYCWLNHRLKFQGDCARGQLEGAPRKEEASCELAIRKR